MSLNKVPIQRWELQASGAGPGDIETSPTIAVLSSCLQHQVGSEGPGSTLNNTGMNAPC